MVLLNVKNYKQLANEYNESDSFDYEDENNPESINYSLLYQKPIEKSLDNSETLCVSQTGPTDYQRAYSSPKVITTGVYRASGTI